ncbi:hypothetical protein MMC34_008597 [Xylographa carneopallida]|nr:hypothetical protein [Xylographa carneopallida]
MSARATLLLLFVLAGAFMPLASAFSLQVYNDSACTVALPQYSYSNAALNYTSPAAVCLNGTIPNSQPASQSLQYQCAFTIAPPNVNLNLLSYTQPNCANDYSWLVYIPGNHTTGANGGLENTCIPMTLLAGSGSGNGVGVYGVVSCAAKTNGAAKGAEGAAGLVAVLLFVAASLLL